MPDSLRLGLSLVGLAAWSMSACTFTSDLESLSAGGAPGAGGVGGTVSTGGRGGEPSEGGSQGMGGTPEAPMCDSPVQCEPPNTKCQVPACIGGECGQAAVASGQLVIGEQTTGDCYKIVCDGGGSQSKEIDAADVPDDLNPCTIDECKGGEPAHSNEQDGTLCGDNLACALGDCAGCTDPNQCPQAATFCATPTCSGSAVCGFDFEPDGAALPAGEQDPGDCQSLVCNGSGQEQSIDEPADLPASDGNECTVASCIAGSPAQVPIAAGSGCADNGVVCDGFGKCVSCVVDGVKNFGEIGVDCGGPLCTLKCPAGTECNKDGECATGYCTDGVCCLSRCADECMACGGQGKCKAVPNGTADPACGVDGICSDGRCLFMAELPQ